MEDNKNDFNKNSEALCRTLELTLKGIRCKACGSEYDDTGILFEPGNVSEICGQCLSEE